MRKHLLLVLTALTIIISFAACTNGTGSGDTKESMQSTYQTISPADAKELIGEEGVILVDVRTTEEYEQGYIPDAVLLPLDDIPHKAESVLTDKSATVIVYCRSGRRSAIAAEELLDMGYKTVYDLGGIQDWPYEITK